MNLLVSLKVDNGAQAVKSFPEGVTAGADRDSAPVCTLCIVAPGRPPAEAGGMSSFSFEALDLRLRDGESHNVPPATRNVHPMIFESSY